MGGGAGGRVIRSLGNKQEVRVQLLVPLKVLGSNRIICEFILCLVCMCIHCFGMY